MTKSFIILIAFIFFFIPQTGVSKEIQRNIIMPTALYMDVQIPSAITTGLRLLDVDVITA